MCSVVRQTLHFFELHADGDWDGNVGLRAGPRHFLFPIIGEGRLAEPPYSHPSMSVQPH